jgi:hypothetical protein
MPGALIAFQEGPLTFPVSNNSVPASAVTGLIYGGQLVCSDSAYDGTVITTVAYAAGSSNLRVIGVAMTDGANPAVSQSLVPPGTSFDLNVSPILPYVAVALAGVFRLTTTSAFNFGDLAVADIYGQVKKYTHGTDTYDQIVAKCVDPAGTVSSGAQGQFALALGF